MSAPKYKRNGRSKHFHVSIADFKFSTYNLRIPVHSTVTWTVDKSSQDELHQIAWIDPTSTDALRDSNSLSAGHKFSQTFHNVGVFQYYCSMYTFMRGKVTVVEDRARPPKTDENTDDANNQTTQSVRSTRRGVAPERHHSMGPLSNCLSSSMSNKQPHAPSQLNKPHTSSQSNKPHSSSQSNKPHSSSQSNKPHVSSISSKCPPSPPTSHAKKLQRTKSNPKPPLKPSSSANKTSLKAPPNPAEPVLEVVHSQHTASSNHASKPSKRNSLVKPSASSLRKSARNSRSPSPAACVLQNNTSRLHNGSKKRPSSRKQAGDIGSRSSVASKDLSTKATGKSLESKTNGGSVTDDKGHQSTADRLSSSSVVEGSGKATNKAKHPIPGTVAKHAPKQATGKPKNDAKHPTAPAASTTTKSHRKGNPLRATATDIETKEEVHKTPSVPEKRKSVVKSKVNVGKTKPTAKASTHKPNTKENRIAAAKGGFTVNGRLNAMCSSPSSERLIAEVQRELQLLSRDDEIAYPRVNMISSMSLPTLDDFVADNHTSARGEGTGKSTVCVGIHDFKFTPKDIVIQKGTCVQWRVDVKHHHHRLEGNGWESPVLGHGMVFSKTFNNVGLFQYSCSIYPWMYGSVKVVKRRNQQPPGKLVEQQPMVVMKEADVADSSQLLQAWEDEEVQMNQSTRRRLRQNGVHVIKKKGEPRIVVDVKSGQTSAPGALAADAKGNVRERGVVADAAEGDVKVRESKIVNEVKSTDSKVGKLSDTKVIKSSDAKVVKSNDAKVAKSSDAKVVKSNDAKSTDPKVAQPSDLERPDSANASKKKKRRKRRRKAKTTANLDAKSVHSNSSIAQEPSVVSVGESSEATVDQHHLPIAPKDMENDAPPGHDSEEKPNTENQDPPAPVQPEIRDQPSTTQPEEPTPSQAEPSTVMPPPGLPECPMTSSNPEMKQHEPIPTELREVMQFLSGRWAAVLANDNILFV